MSDAKRLQEILSRQDDLRRELAESEAQARELRVGLASDSAGQLVKSGEKFLRLFSTGAVVKSFNDVVGCLRQLVEHDPAYSKEFSTVAPYGLELSPEGRYFCQYLLGGPWKADSTLFQVLNRIVDNSTVQGNPLNKEGTNGRS